MAHFYVSTENGRGSQVTASGNKSGQTTHCRGWDSGIRVCAVVDSEGRDCFHVYRTGGSNGGASHLVFTLVGDRVELSNLTDMGG
jgi:hypothetical protein